MKLSKTQWGVFSTLFFIGLAANIEKGLVGVLGPLLQDPEYMASKGLDVFSASQFGLLTTLFYASFILMTFGAGWFVDRFGYAKFVPVCLGIMVVGSLFFGIAGYTSGAALLMLLPIARLVIGFGQAGYTNGTPPIVAKNFAQEQRGSVQGKVVATAGLGTILVYLVFDFIAKADFRWAYFILAALFAIAIVLFKALVPNDAKADEIMGVAPAAAGDKPKVKFSEAWSNRNALVLAAALLLNNLVGVGLLTWANSMYVTQFRDQLDAAPWAQTVIMVMYGVTILVATMFGVDLVKKYFDGKEKFFMLLMSAIGAACLFFTVGIDNLWGSAVMLWISNLFIMLAFSAILVLPYRLIPVRIIGSAFAVINIGAFVGGIVQGSLIGGIVDSAGYVLAFTVLAILLVVAGLVPFLLKEPAPAAPATQNA